MPSGASSAASPLPATPASGAYAAPLPRWRRRLADYVELTKPKVQSLLLLTTVATMYVAGEPSPLLVLGPPGGRLVNTVVLTDAQPRYSADGRALVASSTLAPTGEQEVRDEIARSHDVSAGDLDHLTTVTVTGAQPAALPPLQLRRPVDLGGGVYVCGDHRDTPSIQGAMASGARCARAVLRGLRRGAA